MLIVKIRSEQGSLGKNSGCAEAPDIILNRLGKQGVKFSAEEIPVFKNDIIATDESIYKGAKRILGKKPVFVGGARETPPNHFSRFFLCCCGVSKLGRR